MKVRTTNLVRTNTLLLKQGNALGDHSLSLPMLSATLVGGV